MVWLCVRGVCVCTESVRDLCVGAGSFLLSAGNSFNRRGLMNEKSDIVISIEGKEAGSVA